MCRSGIARLYGNSIFSFLRNFHTVFRRKVKVKSLSRVQLSATPWTVAYQAPPSMGFSRQECWSGFPFPSPGDLPNPGMEPGSPTLQADTLPSEPPGKPVFHSGCANLHPSYSGGGLPFLHTLSKVGSLLDGGHSDWCELVLHCSSGVHFSNDSSVRHLFMHLFPVPVFLLWRNVYLVLWPTF